MRRGNGEGTVFAVDKVIGGRKTKVWRGAVTVAIVGGKQRRKYVQGATKAEATAKLRKLSNDLAAGTLTMSSNPTVEAWLTHYLEDLAPRKVIAGRTGNRRSTLATYTGYARNWVYPHIGAVKLDKLTVDHLEGVYQAMADAGRAHATIKQVHAMLRVALDHAWKRGRAPRNVALLAMLPAGAPAKETRKTTSTEGRSILSAALGERMGARWVVRLAYGLRQGEGLGLCWDDVDFEAGQILIRRELQRDRASHGCGPSDGVQKYRGADGTTRERPRYPCRKAQPARCPAAVGGGLHLVGLKSKASHAPLPLPGPVADILRAWRERQAKERRQAGPRWVGFGGADLVFTQWETGKPIEPRQDWAHWYALLERAGVEPVKPHGARHMAATLLVELGVHPRTAMTMLRHADVTTTLGIYAKAPDADLRAAAEALARLLLGEDSSDDEG